MAASVGAKQVFRLHEVTPEVRDKWQCGDCGTVIEGREGYDRHVACFPNHHPQSGAILEKTVAAS
ncbi:MAG TPA: hypothetical protein VKF15_03200 [Nitrososphaerales archaeon]|nr:hypothetical protein [Nitrososphaerales archaeon]